MTRVQRYALALAICLVGAGVFATAPETLLRAAGAGGCAVAGFFVAFSGRAATTRSKFAGGRRNEDLAAQANLLRVALERNELFLNYQPIVSAETLLISGVEALLRWQHPTRGLLMPASFIPMAEACGMIDAIGEWALRRACEDGRRWPHLHVAVNVSPTQFRKADFIASVIRILDETGFAATRLEIELTESVVIDDAAQAESLIVELRSLGVRVAIDDFGAGYSSLIYLRKFAFDKMKIDKSFIQILDERGEGSIIIDMIVKLGRALGLTITIEGVETMQQQQYLRTLQCDEFQGFLYAPPVSADEIDVLLSTRRWTDEERCAEQERTRSVA